MSKPPANKTQPTENMFCYLLSECDKDDATILYLMGIGRKTLFNWRRKPTSMSVEQAYKLSKIMEVEIGYFIEALNGEYDEDLKRDIKSEFDENMKHIQIP